MLRLAKGLKKDYQVCLVSNLTNEMMREILTKHQIKKYFVTTVFSNKTGYLKPETEIFDLALKKMRAQPKETLFIDDSKTNIRAAQKIGMVTVLATTPSQTIKDIRKTLAKFN
jgi:HAD superfamily hydrolase (TIGR01509 family)